jgi:hypothetical protein
MWKDGESSFEPVEFEGLVGLRRKCQQTVEYVGLRLQGDLGWKCKSERRRSMFFVLATLGVDGHSQGE